uniref:Uncharacterized protein n=1 Tax=Eutreptiella gymnastica TaxID=73025 RepID=A0A7S4FSK0_9EUGL
MLLAGLDWSPPSYSSGEGVGPVPCRSRVRFRTRTGPWGAGPRPPSPIKRQELTPRGAGTAAATEPSGGTAELARAPHGAPALILRTGAAASSMGWRARVP